MSARCSRRSFDSAGVHSLPPRCSDLRRWLTSRTALAQAINAEDRPNDLIGRLGDDLLARFQGTPAARRVRRLRAADDLLARDHARRRVPDHERRAGSRRRSRARPSRTRTASSPRPRSHHRLGYAVRPSTRWTSYRRSPSLPVTSPIKQTDDELTHRPRKPPGRSTSNVEEHAVEDGLLPRPWTTRSSSPNYSPTAGQREEIRSDEIKALSPNRPLFDRGRPRRQSRTLRPALDLETLKKYGDLTEADVKALVLDDKWRATVSARVIGELNATHSLSSRESRARRTLSRKPFEDRARVRELDERLLLHLADMGVQRMSLGLTPTIIWPVDKVGTVGNPR